MATSAAMRSFAYGDGLEQVAQDVRLNTLSALLSPAGGSGSSGLSIGGGVRHGNVAALSVAVSTGLAVTVSAGFAAAQGSAAANTGAYVGTLDTVATLTCATADPVNPRIDSVVVAFTDNGDNTSTAVVKIVTGTAASSPSAPALPANSVLLCNITVPQNAVSLVSGNLSDQRSFYVAAGGIQPALNSTLYPAAAPSSAYLHDISTGRLLRWNGTAWVAASVARFAPYTSDVSGVTTSGTTVATIVSGTITSDGATPVKITLTWGEIVSAGVPTGQSCTIHLNRDGTGLHYGLIKTPYASGAKLDAGTVMFPDTPPAGPHTYTWTIANTAATGTFQVVNATILIEAMSP